MRGCLIARAVLPTAVVSLSVAGASADVIRYELIAPPLTVEEGSLDSYLRAFGVPLPNQYDTETLETYRDLISERASRLQRRAVGAVADAVAMPTIEPLPVSFTVEEDQLDGGSIRNRTVGFFDGDVAGFQIDFDGIIFADYSGSISFDERGQVADFVIFTTTDFGGYDFDSDVGNFFGEDPLFDFFDGRQIVYSGPPGEFVRVSGTPSPIPLPASLSLSFVGLIGLVGLRWRKGG